MEEGEEEGKNNSDVDILEYEGKTYQSYAIGDQATWSTIRAAMYEGTERVFFESHFLRNILFTKVSVK